MPFPCWATLDPNNNNKAEAGLSGAGTFWRSSVMNRRVPKTHFVFQTSTAESPWGHSCSSVLIGSALSHWRLKPLCGSKLTSFQGSREVRGPPLSSYLGRQKRLPSSPPGKSGSPGRCSKVTTKLPILHETDACIQCTHNVSLLWEPP